MMEGELASLTTGNVYLFNWDQLMFDGELNQSTVLLKFNWREESLGNFCEIVLSVTDGKDISDAGIRMN